MTKPITPKQAKQLKAKKPDPIIPPIVFKIVNELIVEKLYNGSAIILQKDIISRLLETEEFENSDEIYTNKYLDFEGHYMKNGWKVEYDKPGYGESYDASFKFTSCEC